MASCLFFLVLLGLSGFAEGAVNQDCSNNACSDDTTVCDSNVCKVKAGGACSGATDCVSQSTCASNLCTCNDGYSAASTGLCSVIDEGKVNAACETNKPCRGTNVACTDNFCKCKGGFSGNKGDNDCKVGVGDDCSTNPCSDDTAVCEANVCKVKAGGTCAATSECVPQSTCASTKCTCNDGYSAAATGLCSAIAQGKVNAACDTTRVCTGSHVACTNLFCTCKAGFSGNKGDDDCKVGVGDDCSTNPCSDDTAVCEANVCKIKDGATCTETADCVSHSSCTGTPTKCSCDDGYSPSATGLCTAIAEGKVNAACETSKPCTGTHVECKDKFCTCKDGFSGNKGDDDCTSNKGVALGQVSVWTLCMTILTMSLAVNVV